MCPVPTKTLGAELKTKRKQITCVRFTAALLTAAKRQKQPECPATEEQRDRMWFHLSKATRFSDALFRVDPGVGAK